MHHYERVVTDPKRIHPPAGAYAHGIRTGNLLFVAGQARTVERDARNDPGREPRDLGLEPRNPGGIGALRAVGLEPPFGVGHHRRAGPQGCVYFSQ